MKKLIILALLALAVWGINTKLHDIKDTVTELREVYS